MNPCNICVPKEDVAVSQLLITNINTHTHANPKYVLSGLKQSFF